ncbi:hypothetical protein PAPYR_2074 [Paratrimastix pyriformis]|uniref:Uncharacterized protein n=1 Tax=Paratrimastix pyriformis TaxID=342808 RepID=A0ABQ8UT39_9EUKA|nr:hypothetical protein PAPYR_2074 [Paratrimastix pyriformis]
MLTRFELASAGNHLMLKITKAKREIQENDPPLLLHLPPELLLVLVDASEFPLNTYILLLGLCHSTRVAVRGVPSTLSFALSADADPLLTAVTTPTAAALAALVRPCKNLVKLTLTDCNLPLCWSGRTEAACTAWVDEAFAGHDSLAVLDVPSPVAVLPALPSIVRHLHGLEEFHFGVDPYAILSRRVPGPQNLQLEKTFGELWKAFAEPLLAALGRELQLPMMPEVGAEDSAAISTFMGNLTSLRRLALGWAPPAFLRPLATHLTQLRLLSFLPGDLSTDEALADVGLCRLETLQLALAVYRPANINAYARLLAANRATLRSVTLQMGVAPPVLLGALDGLPQLANLTMILSGACSTGWSTSPCILTTPRTLAVRIASRRLRTLCFDVRRINLGRATLDLACPCLEELALPENAKEGQNLAQLIMDCPRLRCLEGLPGDPCVHRWTVTPHLLRVRGIAKRTKFASAWLPRLLAGSPRLRNLASAVHVKEPATMARLLGSESLCRLSLIAAVTVFPVRPNGRGHVRALRLPAQLERLEATIHWGDPQEGTVDLEVESPGLRSLTLLYLAPGEVRLTLRCPALAALHLDVPTFAALSELIGPGPAPPLLNIAIISHSLAPSKEGDPDFSAARLLDGLGAHLRCLSLRGSFPGWPQLAVAIGRLPRLAVLKLEDLTATGDLILTCPLLRRFTIQYVLFRSLVLDCPLLENLSGGWCLDSLKRFELTGPVPPHLRLDTDAARLAKRFPWMQQLPLA